MDDDFIGPEVVAQITGISLDSLAQLRTKGNGPSFYKPTPRRVRYRQSEVLSWLEANHYVTTSKPVRA